MKTKAHYRSKASKLIALQDRLELIQSYRPDAKLPETKAEIFSWFYNLLNELSPENLSHDGELSTRQVNKKHKSILREWRQLETLLGEGKVNDEQVYKFVEGE